MNVFVDLLGSLYALIVCVFLTPFVAAFGVWAAEASYRAIVRIIKG